MNPNTVAKAYRDLEQMGVVLGRNGRSVFVTEGGPAIARETRRTAKRVAFERAIREALRAGHELPELLYTVSNQRQKRNAG